MLNVEEYENNKVNVCIEFETSTLGAPVTYKPWWDTIEVDETVIVESKVVKLTEKIDRNGNMMAFVNIEINNSIIEAIVFARQYCKNHYKFTSLTEEDVYVKLKGKKDNKNKLIVSSVL